VLGVTKAFLTRERMRIVLRVTPVSYLLGLCFVYTKNIRFDAEHGLLLASDFFCFWLAAKAAVSIDPVLVYDNTAFLQFGGSLFEEGRFLHFFYPPTFLMLIEPLGHLPNSIAFLVFVGVGIAGYAVFGRCALGTSTGVLYLLALPTVLFAIYHGQNSLLLCALFGGALVAMRSKRFVLAGILIGCLTVKPQLGLLIPFALLAGRYWTVFAVAALTTVLLSLTSWAIFGSDTWVAFFNQTVLAREIVNHEQLPFLLHVTVFSTLQQFGIPYSTAMSLQITLAICLVILTVWIWRLEVPFDLKAAGLSAAALLASPYLLSYDLALMAIPFIFLLHFARGDVFSGPEKLTFVAAIVIASLAKIINYNLGLPLGPLAPALMLGLTWRRVHVLSRAAALEVLPEAAQARDGRCAYA